MRQVRTRIIPVYVTRKATVGQHMYIHPPRSPETLYDRFAIECMDDVESAGCYKILKLARLLPVPFTGRVLFVKRDAPGLQLRNKAASRFAKDQDIHPKFFKSK